MSIHALNTKHVNNAEDCNINDNKIMTNEIKIGISLLDWLDGAVGESTTPSEFQVESA